MAKNQILFRDTTPSDISDLIRLAKAGLGSDWTDKFVRWKYFGNPDGHIYGRCAEYHERKVGFYGNIPVRLKLGQQIVLGAQAVDAVVDESVRRHGVFAQLATESYQQMDRDNVALTYAFPNPVSQKAFLERLAWSFVGHIPRFVKVLNPQSIVSATALQAPRAWAYRVLYEYVRLISQRRMPPRANNIVVREIREFDERVTTFWQSVQQSFAIAVVKDMVYLNWRYAKNPLRNYKVFIADTGATLCGILVLSLRNAQQDKAIAITEFLVQPDNVEAGSMLLRSAELVAREIGYSQLHCWMLPHHSFYVHLLNQNGFVFRPIRVLPQFLDHVTPLIIRRHPEKAWQGVEPSQISNWFVSMGDHDYF